MIVFDEFEGDEYFKSPVKPRLLRDDSSVEALIYLWQPSLTHLLYGEWDPEHFAATLLDKYVDMCYSFAEELREEQGPPQSRPLGFE